MSRQPYAPVYAKEKPVYGPGQVPMKPKMAEAVGRCIMVWSYVEWQMALLLAAMMKANSEASIAIFLTLRNARTQRDVLTAAAGMTLSDPDKELFDATMLLYFSLQTQRADIAHGIFGGTKGHSDGMPWIEAKNLSRQWIEKFHQHQQFEAAGMLADKLAEIEAEKRLISRSSFYRLEDLNQLHQEILGLWEVVFHLYLAIRDGETKLGIEQRVVLSALPQMKRALARLRTPQPPPKP